MSPTLLSFFAEVPDPRRGQGKMYPLGRITRGEFRRISESVVQICKVLGLEIDAAALEPNAETAAWAKLQASLRGLWDKTPEGADKIVRVLDTIGALRGR